MNKVFLGLTPILYVKDNSKIKLYLDLADKDYRFEDITQLTFMLSQNADSCVVYQYYENEEANTEQGVETYYDAENQRVGISLILGATGTDTETFVLNQPIKFEIAVDALTYATNEEGQTLVYAETFVESQPDIIITPAQPTVSLYRRLQKVGVFDNGS